MTNKGLLELVQKEGEILKATMTDFEDPAFTTWHTKLVEIMAKVYGEGTREYDSIAKMAFGPTILSSRTTDQEILETYKESIGTALAKLAAYISLMDDTPVAENEPGTEAAVDIATNSENMPDKELLESLYNRGQSLLSKISKPSEEHLVKDWREEVDRAITKIYGDYSPQSQQLEQVGGLRWHYMAGDESESDEIAKWLNSQHADIKDILGLLSAWVKEFPEEKKMGNKVFIVYGHDEVLRSRVTEFLNDEGIEYIRLDKVSGSGTLINKFEETANEAGCAICLLTGSDDESGIRPNVLFEMGYFAGKLGMNKVIILSNDKQSFPSDLQGLYWVDANNFKYDLLRELRHIGIVPAISKGATLVERV